MRNKKKNSHSCVAPKSVASVEAYPVGVVLDGVLQDVVVCSPRMQAILLSNPVFVDLDAVETKPAIGDSYSNGAFSPSH